MLIFDYGQKASSPLPYSPRSSWLPSQRMLVRYGFLPWSCCGSVWSCSDVLFMQVLPSVASGFACPMCRWDGHPCLLWVGRSSSPSGAFTICSCEAVAVGWRAKHLLALTLFRKNTGSSSAGRKMVYKTVFSWRLEVLSGWTVLDTVKQTPEAWTRVVMLTWLGFLLTDARNYSLLKAHGYWRSIESSQRLTALCCWVVTTAHHVNTVPQFCPWLQAPCAQCFHRHQGQASQCSVIYPSPWCL